MLKLNLEKVSPSSNFKFKLKISLAINFLIEGAISMKTPIGIGLTDIQITIKVHPLNFNCKSCRTLPLPVYFFGGEGGATSYLGGNTAYLVFGWGN